MRYLISKVGQGITIMAALAVTGCTEPRNELAAPVIDHVMVKQLRDTVQ